MPSSTLSPLCSLCLGLSWSLLCFCRSGIGKGVRQALSHFPACFSLPILILHDLNICLTSCIDLDILKGFTGSCQKIAFKIPAAHRLLDLAIFRLLSNVYMLSWKCFWLSELETPLLPFGRQRVKVLELGLASRFLREILMKEDHLSQKTSSDVKSHSVKSILESVVFG